MARIAAIYRYPVKGLSAERLERAPLATGGTIPFDRAYAIENGPSGFDPAAPKHRPKIAFLMLMRNERLARLRTHFDDATAVLSIEMDGAQIADGCLETTEGRRTIEAFLEEFARDDLRGAARIVSAPSFSFSDYPGKVVSLINLETVRAIGERLGKPLDPLRFRGNLYVEGCRRGRSSRGSTGASLRVAPCSAPSTASRAAPPPMSTPRRASATSICRAACCRRGATPTAASTWKWNPAARLPPAIRSRQRSYSSPRGSGIDSAGSAPPVRCSPPRSP